MAEPTIRLTNTSVGRIIILVLTALGFLAGSILSFILGPRMGDILLALVGGVGGLAMVVLMIYIIYNTLRMPSHTVVFSRQGIILAIGGQEKRFAWHDIRSIRLMTETEGLGAMTFGQDVLAVFLAKKSDLEIINPNGFGLIVAGQKFQGTPKPDFFIRPQALGQGRIDRLPQEFREKFGVDLKQDRPDAE